MKRIEWVEQRVVIHASVDPRTGHVERHALNRKFTLKEAMRYVPVHHNWLVAWLPKTEAIAVIDLLGSARKLRGGTKLMMKPPYVTRFNSIEAAIMWAITNDH